MGRPPDRDRRVDAYTETLFTALAEWALDAVLTRGWLPVGVLVALAYVLVLALLAWSAVRFPTAALVEYGAGNVRPRCSPG